MSAEGESLVDLLDNYLKACVKDKKIEPFGGVLYDEYNYAWNPPGTVAWLVIVEILTTFPFICADFDMNVLQERLKEQKRMREKAAKNRTPPSQRKEQYTPVEIDAGSSAAKMDSPTDSESSGDGASRQKLHQLPLTSAKPYKSHSSSTSEGETTPKRKPLPPAPAKKPIEPPKCKLTSEREDSVGLSTPPQSLIDRMNQPLPPTPGENSQPQSRFKPPSPSATLTTPMHDNNSTSQARQPTGSALLKEMMAKHRKDHSDGYDTRNAKKKQPVPVPKQRPIGKKTSAPTGSGGKALPNSPIVSSHTTEQLHEPASYANLPVHDTPYQNMGFGVDKAATPQEPDAMYENVHQRTSNKKQAQKVVGYINVKTNGSGAGACSGSEYQNINASRRPRH